MNKLIKENYPKTEDAVLVDKWFGAEIDEGHLISVLIPTYKEVVLYNATQLEKSSSCVPLWS